MKRHLTILDSQWWCIFLGILAYPIKLLHKTCLLRRKQQRFRCYQGRSFSFRFRTTLLTWFARLSLSSPAFFQCTAFSPSSSLLLLACVPAVCGLKALLTFTHQSEKKVQLISPKAITFLLVKRRGNLMTMCRSSFSLSCHKFSKDMRSRDIEQALRSSSFCVGPPT